MHLKDWQKLFTPVTINKAAKYVDRVTKYSEDGNKISALIQGEKLFNVSFEINQDREVTNLKCDCDFAKEGNNCKHQVGLIMYYEREDKTEQIKTSEIYPLDLVYLAKNGMISHDTRELFINRKNILIPSYRIFEVNTDKGVFYEIICDKYEEGKGRLFINKNYEFFVLDVDIRKETYAIFDVFMGAKQCFPGIIAKNLKEYDEYIIHSDKVKLLLDLSKSLDERVYPEPLELEPILDLEKKVVSYKILVNKGYNIKDLKVFSEAILRHDVLNYGKLSFVHGYEYFSHRSQKHLDFILHQVNLDNTITKDIKLDNPYAVDFFFSTCKKQKIKVEGKNDTYVNISNQLATIILKSKSLEIFDRNKIRFVGSLGAYYDNLDTIEYRPFSNHGMREVFSYLAQNDGIVDLSDIYEEFILNVFPKIKKYITITDEFYEENTVPSCDINTYVTLNENGNIVLNKEVIENNVVVNELSDYSKVIYSMYEHIILDEYKFKPHDDYYRLDNLKEQYLFLSSSLDNLKDYGNVYLDEKVLDIKPKPRRGITISAKYDVDFLRLSIEGLDYSKEDIELILKAYKQKLKYIKLNDGSIIELNEKLDYLREILDDFNIDLNDDFSNIERPLSYAFKLLNHEGYEVSFDQNMQDFVNSIQNYKKTSYYIPENLKSLLKPYQLEANSWLNTLAKNGFGGILADDMGLGKTIETISLLLGDEKQMPSLVVCPMSLVYNWQQEIIKWNVDIKCVPISGNQTLRKELITNIKQDEKIIYITSYDSLRRDLKNYSTKFRFIIADEAQYIKNQFAQKSEAIKMIDSEVRFALTGTPIENGLQDVWNIFDFIAPGYLSNYQVFKTRYENLILNRDKGALRRLRSKLMPFILRRTKKDVLKDLPDKTESIYYTKLSDEEQKLYDANVLKLKEDLIRADGAVVLSMLTRLRQICVDPKMYLTDYKEDSSKLLLCIDILKKSISGGHKTLIFSQFTSVFPSLEKLLNNEGIRFLKITGSTKAEERVHLVNEFNESDIPVMLISLKAGGTGLNLQSADTVIHLDPWWNVSVENQATDRAHRIGQKNQVNVIKLVAKNTIEDKVLELQRAKKNLADSILDYANADKLTLSDIKELLD